MKKKGRKKNDGKIIKILGICFLFFISLSISFFFGMHWQSNFQRWLISSKSIDKLSCYGNNNLFETYSLDCIFPLTKNQQNFQYKENLKCKGIMNHQYRNTMWKNNSPQISNLTSIYANTVSFELHVNSKTGQLYKSHEAGSVEKGFFTIVQNDENIIQAIRKMNFDTYFGDTYETILLSKKTGKGIRAWINTEDYYFQKDSAAMFFIQCE